MRFRDDMQIDYVQHMGSDEIIARAARVSTGKDVLKQDKIQGLINYLVRERHTSPLEHCVTTIRAEVPIFVAREWVRHRTQSYSEFSMRFSEAEPEFYLPAQERPLVNAGNGAHPKLVPADDPETYSIVKTEHGYVAEEAWEAYQNLVRNGVAHEVARNVLPVSTYTKFYATANLNNWFKFLSLRDGRQGAPQWEIVQAAKKVASIIQEHYPLAYAAFERYRFTQPTSQEDPA